jgi:hypothetical protein
MIVRRQRRGRISQGDIYKDVEFIENVLEKHGIFQISKVIFPYVIVLTQDCDLEQDSKVRYNKIKAQNQDKLILSVLVAPIYNVEQVYVGEHLTQLKIKMQLINRGSSPGQNLRNNQTPRYHFLDFSPDSLLSPSVIDFKHYFSVHVEYLRGKKSDFVCSVSPLFREDISQRFASYLGRIGLPEPRKKPTTN